MKKEHISATICLTVSVAIMVVTSMNFLAAREVPMPKNGPGVTEVKMLSDWYDGLKGSAGDTPVYVLEGEQEGGSMLFLGGTHANEPSSYLSAITYIETAVVESGTVYVIPYANISAMTHNDPGEANLQYFTIPTENGDREFRFGSRATNPVDQWPDPDVYTHVSGQKLSGSETRNLNRSYPGRTDGSMTEQIAYAITELIKTEDVDISFDLHEASPEYPVINATVAHQNASEVAAIGCLNLLMGGIDMALEVSPVNLRGLTHREWGDSTDTLAFLMETANASQGRLRGASTEAQLLGGIDKFYVINEGLGMLYVPYDESGHSIEERVGRHIQGLYDYTAAYNQINPENTIVFSGAPTYAELYLNAPDGTLGGAHLGSFLL